MSEFKEGDIVFIPFSITQYAESDDTFRIAIRDQRVLDEFDGRADWVSPEFLTYIKELTDPEAKRKRLKDEITKLLKELDALEASNYPLT